MGKAIAVTIILSITAIICMSMWIYYSPYHTCVRDGEHTREDPNIVCAYLLGGGDK